MTLLPWKSSRTEEQAQENFASLTHNLCKTSLQPALRVRECWPWPCILLRKGDCGIRALHPEVLCAMAAGRETAKSPALQEEQCRVARAQKEGLTDMLLVGLGGTWLKVAGGWQGDIDLRLSHFSQYIWDVWGPLLLKPCQYIFWLRHKARGGGSSRDLLLMFNVVKSFLQTCLLESLSLGLQFNFHWRRRPNYPFSKLGGQDGDKIASALARVNHINYSVASRAQLFYILSGLLN